jgi:hypothetical protein
MEGKVMKRIFSMTALAFACVGLVLLSAGCAKEEEGWKRFARSDEGKHSYAPESVFRKTEAIVAVTERVKHGRDSKTYRVEFHCTERRYVRTLMEDTASGAGKDAATFPQLTSRPPMEQVPQDSPAEKLFVIVCQ